MELSPLAELGFGTLFAVILIFIHYCFFRPYRNRWMRWYMRRFNRDYRVAKKVFDQVVRKHALLRKNSADPQTADCDFMVWLYHDEYRFTAMKEECLAKKEHENTFVFFVGKKKVLHKVKIEFSFVGDLHLHCIKLFYDETVRTDRFVHIIEKKLFPPDFGDAVFVPSDPVLSAVA